MNVIRTLVWLTRGLEREVDEAASWSPVFLDALRQVPPETATAVDDMLEVIRTRRSSTQR